jgi:type IV pilus assembly protein PilZ
MSHLAFERGDSAPARRSLLRPNARRTKKIVVEKRGHPRTALKAVVTCHRKDGTTFEGRSKDISIGGMYLESTEAVAFGTELTIEVSLPRTKGALRLPAVVRWTDKAGFGVQFGLLGARETHAISQLIRS